MPEELAEWRKKGLCFHCNNKYNPGHNCPKFFKIEACWEEEDNDVEMEIENGSEDMAP